QEWKRRLAERQPGRPSPGNTTLLAVITNQRRLGRGLVSILSRKRESKGKVLGLSGDLRVISGSDLFSLAADSAVGIPAKTAEKPQHSDSSRECLNAVKPAVALSAPKYEVPNQVSNCIHRS